MHDVELVVTDRVRQGADGDMAETARVVMARVDGHPLRLPVGGTVEAVTEAGGDGWRVTLSIIARHVTIVDLAGVEQPVDPSPPGKINNGPLPL